ncbi:MAG: glutamine-hydrolyzing GMP synthase [Acidobacteriota bacterium]|nr:glutamine-hydrolyzing GMP synthase [Acidobacteriota bacterium]
MTLPHGHVAHQTIFVLDFGSQYTQLIARRLRELSVYSEIVSYAISADELARKRPQGIILSGGPSSLSETGAPKCDPGVFDLDIPVLGICYGMQLLTSHYGGVVGGAADREYGPAAVSVTAGSAEELFSAVPQELKVWASHGDFVREAPTGFEVLAVSPNAPVTAMVDARRKRYGLLFHPEVVHTEHGPVILKNFTHICGCRGDWTMSSFVEEAIEAIRRTVGSDGRVVCGLSGGVDSTVAAVLIHRAIGDRLTCIFVDNGLLRLNERQQVEDRFTNQMQLPVVYEDASQRFVDALSAITDPEQKRKLIGKTFIDVFEQSSKRIGEFDFLAQGTLYPDVIESVSVVGPSAAIKSHHNVGGLPEHLRFTLVEPLRELFKDEVRVLGTELGLDDEFVWRQPFPGPGLAVRIVGEVTVDRLDLLRQADAVVAEEIKRAGLYRDIWQSFAVLLPVQSVGVMGDERTYEYTIAIRAVESRDGMTADWARLPHELLAVLSNRIVNEVQGINRVVYDISSKPPSTIEWE